MKGIFDATLFLGHWLMTKAFPVLCFCLLTFAIGAIWFQAVLNQPAPAVSYEQGLAQQAEQERSINRYLGQPENQIIPELHAR